MHLHSLLIRHFRLISDTVLTLQPGIQLFLGLNAQGKTSLIEAIHFLSTSTSHRTNREEDLIQWSESVAFLRGIVQDRDEQYTIECGLEKKRKVIKIDSVPLPRVGDLYGKLRTVLFAPEDLNIVVGSPHDRRRFLDMAIAQLDPGYIPILQQFRRALHQRNHVLKRVFQRRESEVARELAVWDIPYLQNAVHVISLRIKHVKELAPLVDQYYAGLADEGPCYCSERIGEQEIHSRLKKNWNTAQVELEQGALRWDLIRMICFCICRGGISHNLVPRGSGVEPPWRFVWRKPATAIRLLVRDPCFSSMTWSTKWITPAGRVSGSRSTRRDS